MSDPDPARREAMPETLSYATPREHDRGHPAFTVVGFFAAGLFWFIVVFGASLVVGGVLPNSESIKVAVAIGSVVMFSIAIVAIVRIIIGRRGRRFFILGCLLGTAVMGLLQGICFLNI